MKNRLTLSELRNVIKEEIQFQMKKRELFENLDKKTLKRMLREVDENLIPELKPTFTKFLPINGDVLTIQGMNPNDSVVIKRNDSDTKFIKIEQMFIIQPNFANQEDAIKKLINSKPENNLVGFSDMAIQVRNVKAMRLPTLSLVGGDMKPVIESFKVDLVITLPSTIEIKTEDFKGKVTGV